MNLGEALTRAKGLIDSRDAQYLLADLLKLSRASIIAHPERDLTVPDENEFERRVADRANGKPVAYIIGTREFYGRDFLVNKHVLIPRPETEILVEQALVRLSGHKLPESRTGARVLELGTGSGAISITLALESPQSQIMACDIDKNALDTAQQNAHHLGASVEFVESNWYAALGDRTFDLIISNPPYVARGDAHLAQGDLRFEPPIALTDGSVDGLDSICTIIDGAPAHLSPGGWLLFEHGFDQSAPVRDALLKAGLSSLICIKDLAGIPRVSGGQIR